MAFVFHNHLADADRQYYFLNQFKQLTSIGAEQSEDETLDKLIQLDKKRALTNCKQLEQDFGIKFILKQIAKRVTVEGEHT